MTLEQDKEQLLQGVKNWKEAREQVEKIKEKIKREEEKLKKPLKVEDIKEYLEINNTPLEEIKRLKEFLALINEEFPFYKLDIVDLARKVVEQEIKEDSTTKAIEKEYKKELRTIVKALEKIKELEKQLIENCSKHEQEWSKTCELFVRTDINFDYTRILPLFTRLREYELMNTSIQEIKEFLDK